jgi:uncharacterized LabA/DUF88 family protein
MPIIKHKEQRVGVFIDAQNIYHTAKNLYGRRVNFGEVVKSALADRKLVRAIAYVITSEAGDEKAFFEALTNMGIETKTKDLQVFSSGAKKADWDVGLAVDAIKLAPKLDAVILMSGDGDFIPLVEYLQVNEGCQVEVVAFAKSSSMNLKEACDDFLDLSEDPKRYLIGFGAQKRRRGKKYKTAQRSGFYSISEKITGTIPQLCSI